MNRLEDEYMRDYQERKEKTRIKKGIKELQELEDQPFSCDCQSMKIVREILSALKRLVVD